MALEDFIAKLAATKKRVAANNHKLRMALIEGDWDVLTRELDEIVARVDERSSKKLRRDEETR